MCSGNVISHVFVLSVSFLALLFLSSVFTREKTHLGICQIACVTGKVSYSWIIVAFEPAHKLWINAVYTQAISEIWSQNLARVFIRFPEVIELMTFIFSFCIAPAILADLLFNT